MGYPWEKEKNPAPEEGNRYPWKDFNPPLPAEKKPTLAEYGRSLINAAARPTIEAINALPAFAQDVGVAARNATDKTANALAPDLMKKVYAVNQKIGEASGHNPLVESILPSGPDGNYELPSQMYQRAIDEKFAPPATTTGKVGEFINTLLVGGGLPGPKSLNGNTLPDSVRTAQEAERAHKLAILRDSQKLGAVVPPATINPTYTNRMLESLGGKYATAQQAAVDNVTNFTNPLARESLKAPSNAVLDKGTLDVMRKYAETAYEDVRGAGVFTAPKSYIEKLDSLAADANKAARSFPEIGNQLGGEQLLKAITMAKGNAANIPGARPKLNADDTISAIRLLRGKAMDAYAQGEHAAGKTYKQIATAMESALEQGLIARGKDGAKYVADLRSSREQLAKIFTVLESSNPITGEVSAKTLGQKLIAGEPLTGGLLTAARFGAAYPKEGRLLHESVGVNQLTANMGLLAANQGGNAGVAATGLPLLGAGIRKFLLSPVGQKILTRDRGSVGRSLSSPLVVPNSFYGTERLLGTLPKKKENNE